MKLDKLHIDNFGKLQNLDLNFNENFNQIIEENGWGKTTLSVFIKAMFFGMPSARENIKAERKKYMPWQGGNFGGSIEYTTKEGSFRLIRYFGKTPEGDSLQLIDLATNKICSPLKIEIGEEIFGVGRETFEMTAFFPQLNFLSSTNYKISASVLGLDKFKYDLANLTQAVDLIKKRVAVLKKEKPKNEEIVSMKREIEGLNTELTALGTKLQEFKIQAKEKDEVIKRLSVQQSQLAEQVDLADKLAQTKKNLESDLLAKSDYLNSLLLQIDNIRKEKNEIIHNKGINKFAIPFLTAGGTAILAVFIMLGVFNILSLAISIVTSVSWAALVIVAIVLLLRLKPVGRDDKIKIEEYKKQENEIENNVEILKASIETIKSSLENYSEIESPSLEQYNVIKEQLYNEKIENMQISIDYKNVQRDYDAILEKYENLQEELKTKESLMEEIQKKIELLLQTKSFLMKANENVSSRFIQPVNSAMSEILGKLNMRGREFLVDTDFSIKEKTETGIKELEYSSQGFQDMLSFSMRMYLIKEIYKKEKPFVVLDDTFVNLDDGNMEKIKQLTKEFAKDNQIIYTCCNSRCSLR